MPGPFVVRVAVLVLTLTGGTQMTITFVTIEEGDSRGHFGNSDKWGSCVCQISAEGETLQFKTLPAVRLYPSVPICPLFFLLLLKVTSR